MIKKFNLLLIIALGAISFSALTAEDFSSIPPSADGAKKLLSKFLSPSANHAAMSKLLIPSAADCATFFTNKALAKKANQIYPKMLASGGIKPNAGQTELLIWSATGKELADGTGNSQYFPGEYKIVAKDINPNQVVYAFKFVKPGSKTGMAFDGITHVNGKWKIFPKPWRLAQ